MTAKYTYWDTLAVSHVQQIYLLRNNLSKCSKFKTLYSAYTGLKLNIHKKTIIKTEMLHYKIVDKQQSRHTCNP